MNTVIDVASVTAVSGTETSVYDIGNGQINSIRMSEKTGALNCMHDQRCVLVKTYRIGSYESEGMKSNNPKAGIKEVDQSNTLDLSGSNPARNQGGICTTGQMGGVIRRDTEQSEMEWHSPVLTM